MTFDQYVMAINTLMVDCYDEDIDDCLPESTVGVLDLLAWWRTGVSVEDAVDRLDAAADEPVARK